MLLIPTVTCNEINILNHCTFDISPLPRGMGHTIGNALRRTMLAQLTGFAATSIRIDGVCAETDDFNGIEESILDVILNVKNIVVSLQGGIKHKAVVIDVTGPCTVFASDLQDPELAVVNPSQQIAAVRMGHQLHMEITFEEGRGYECAVDRPSTPNGAINIDAMFTPARRVNYYVEPTRVGDRTDFDKLTMEIRSDGTKTPKEILAWSAALIQQNLLVFAGDSEPIPEDIYEQ